MKILRTCLITAALIYTSLTNAGVVVAEESDTTLGKGVGAWAGVLVGGAAGGPLGALAVGFVGAWGGGVVQEAAGQSGVAYRVARDDGSETVVRSPKQKWNRGDSVQVVSNRLVSTSP